MSAKTTLVGGTGLLAGAGALYALGAFKGLVAIAGAAFVGVVLTWPMVGLICVILAGTCFQIVGSSELIGLPMSLGKLFGLLTLAGWGIHFWRRRPTLTHSAQLYPLGILLVVITASAIFEPLMLQRAGQPLLGMVGVFRMLQVYLLFFLLANLAGEDRTSLLTAVTTVAGAAAATGLIAILEYYYPIESLWGVQPEGFTIGAIVEESAGIEMRRVTGGVGDPNWLAYTAATALPINLFLWRRFHSSIAKLLVLGATGLELVALVLSYTRSGFFGLAFAMAYLLYRKRLPILPLAGLALLGAAASPFFLPPGFVERVLSTKYLREGSTPARRELLVDGVDACLEKPFLGHGYGQFGYFYLRQIQQRPRTDWSDEVESSVERGREVPENIGVHCMYLEICVEYGLAGLVPFLLILVFARQDLILVEATGNQHDRELAICLTACLVCFAVCAVFGHIKILKILWIIMGLSAALRHVVLTAYPKTSPSHGPPSPSARISDRL